MRRIRVALTLAIMVTLLFSTLVISAPKPEQYNAKEVEGCTTILVGKLASADGSVLMAHTEDMDPDDVGRIYIVPAANHKPNETVWLPWATVPQPAHTLRYIAVGNADKVKYEGNILDALNEKGVGMSCNAIWTNDPPMKPGTGLKRYSIREIVPARATSARNAVDLVAELVEKYGQGGTDVMDIAYCFTDQKEAWVIEATAHQWVAKRVPDNSFLVWANEVIIQDDWDLASPTILSESKKLGKKVNFKARYGKGLGENWNTARKARAEKLLQDKVGKITVQDLMAVLRDHFENDPNYYYPPHFGQYYPPDEIRRRPICVDETQEHLIWQMKDGLPAELGAKMWFGPATTCTGVFVPVYAGAMAIPLEYSLVEQRFTRQSAWWMFKAIGRLVDKDYKTYVPYVATTWQDFEKDQFQRLNQVETKAQDAYERGNILKGREILTKFTCAQLDIAFRQAQILLDWLTAQLIDLPANAW